ncbi:hypothetical protein COLO4_01694 [Corchorus olitorius]|uniref:Uncharacterized protein n=1 Tax=Corchorus olitorius TaxID=93759 RepID=A0A1R3L270_9ROSI|nr:hypothetical protein COLO4_01694 [Corchorus olitorius]
MPGQLPISGSRERATGGEKKDRGNLAQTGESLLAPLAHTLREGIADNFHCVLHWKVQK